MQQKIKFVTMKISQIPLFYNQVSFGTNRKQNFSQPALLSQPICDTVSFGNKKHSNPHLTKLQKKAGSHISTQQPSEIHERKLLRQEEKEIEAQERIAAKLEYERVKEKLRKTYLTKSFADSIKYKTISEERLNFIISKLSGYPDLLAEFFFNQAERELIFDVPEKATLKIFEGLTKDAITFLNTIEQKDSNGKILMEKISLPYIKIINEACKNSKPLLLNLYTTPNKKKEIPAHYLSVAGLEEMNRSLKNYPFALAQIYTSRDAQGNTPAHNRFKKGMATIREALKHQPQVLANISKSKNCKGEFCDTALKEALKYKGPYNNTFNYIIENF